MLDGLDGSGVMDISDGDIEVARVIQIATLGDIEAPLFHDGVEGLLGPRR